MVRIHTLTLNVSKNQRREAIVNETNKLRSQSLAKNTQVPAVELINYAKFTRTHRNLHSYLRVGDVDLVAVARLGPLHQDAPGAPSLTHGNDFTTPSNSSEREKMIWGFNVVEQTFTNVSFKSEACSPYRPDSRKRRCTHLATNVQCVGQITSGTQVRSLYRKFQRYVYA